MADTRGARSAVYTMESQIRKLLAPTTDGSSPASWAVAIVSVNMEFVVFPGARGRLDAIPFQKSVTRQQDLLSGDQ